MINIADSEWSEWEEKYLESKAEFIHSRKKTSEV